MRRTVLFYLSRNHFNIWLSRRQLTVFIPASSSSLLWCHTLCSLLTTPWVREWKGKRQVKLYYFENNFDHLYLLKGSWEIRRLFWDPFLRGSYSSLDGGVTLCHSQTLGHLKGLFFLSWVKSKCKLETQSRDYFLRGGWENTSHHFSWDTSRNHSKFLSQINCHEGSAGVAG